VEREREREIERERERGIKQPKAMEPPMEVSLGC